MSKRSSPGSDEDSQGASTDEPIRKKRLVVFEPVRICSINATVSPGGTPLKDKKGACSSLRIFELQSDIDAKVLAVQHYKLSERFRHKERQRDQLQKRVEQLESRQAQDDAMLCIINRSWNRFDEDVRILLQRFDAETALEGEIEMEYEGTKNFLAKLSHWENDEIEDKLKQRVEFRLFDLIILICLSSVVKSARKEGSKMEEGPEVGDLHYLLGTYRKGRGYRLGYSDRRAIAKMVQVFDHITQRNEKIANLIASCPTSDETNEGASTSDEGGSNNQSKPSLSVEVAKMNAELSKENTRLQNMVTKLQSENHSLSVKVSAQEDELTLMETRQEEMTNSLEEVKYQLEKSMRRECKLDFRLAEYVRKAQQMEMNDVKTVNANGIGSASNTTNVSKSKLEELEQSLEMQTELATSRLQELQEMLEKNKNLTRQLETLKLNLKHTPSEVVKNSTEYMALQSQYSALYMEATQMRQQLEVARTQMAALRTAHAKQIEVMESEECLAQERMRDTVSELEEQLSQVRKEYEMLRLEFEQNLSANEQSGPVNKEIRMLLTSFKTQNEQLKQESSRFKRKWKEAVSLLAKCNKELEGEKRYRERCLLIEVEEEGDSLASPDQEKNSTSTADSVIDGSALEHGELAETDNDVSGPPHKVIQKLKKKIVELQSRLDALNSLSTEQRDRVELLARERRLKQENEKMQSHLRKLVGADRREKMRYYSEDAQRKIRLFFLLIDLIRNPMLLNRYPTFQGYFYM
ncbi:unnamed protein product [Toxocara canis]|uniref:E3 ubiquitin protein ligase n=1 Tax=Toxocara canis TaxID=6265 RepID=A0A183USR2_TOXCA|nr:unnamed protein product [Toxocara canis]